MRKAEKELIPKRARRTATLNIRVLPDALAQWKHAAQCAEVSLTEWVEHHLDRAVKYKS